MYDAADDPGGFAPHYGADPSSFMEYERHRRDRDPRFAHAIARPGAVLSDVMVIDLPGLELRREERAHTPFGGRVRKGV